MAAVALDTSKEFRHLVSSADGHMLQLDALCPFTEEENKVITSLTADYFRFLIGLANISLPPVAYHKYEDHKQKLYELHARLESLMQSRGPNWC